MNIYLPPVVIGSSFAGVLVSLSLSRAGVQHILIGGDEPDDSPRLGESLNECASPELFSEYSEEFPDCFHTKSHIRPVEWRLCNASSRREPWTV